MHLAGLLWLCSIHVPAEAAPRTDLRIVVDVSAAMHQADPDNLRGAGVELLARTVLSRADKPDQTAMGGVWAYSQLTQQLVKYAPMDGLWQQVATIHARNIAGQSSQADLPAGVEAATWDLQRPDRPTTHLVLFSNGRIDTGMTPLEHDNKRQLLLNAWASKLRNARVHVHTVAVAGGAAEQADLDLLRQISELSGGLHKKVTSLNEMQAFLLDVVQLMQLAPQALPDSNGRFQVAPGAAAMNVIWLAAGVEDKPVLVQPDGARLDRVAPLPAGRWVLAQDFEMVTIQEPQVGWWQVEGVKPERLTVMGELEIRVDGIQTPVIPTEESHALIRLFSEGQLVDDPGFLNLLNVRVWLSDEHRKVPLPVDVIDGGYQAFFVNLGDGAYELEVEVLAPTFRRYTRVSFVAANPLQVDFKPAADGGVVAWLNFSHADVDYSTVRAAAKVRKPPHVGTIVPAQRMPAGLFEVPVQESEGVVELSFTISGNYLNKKGFFLKTRPQTLTLPLLEETAFSFDANGKLLRRPNFARAAEVLPEVQDNPSGLPADSPPGQEAATQSGASAPVQPQEPPLPLIPLWFVSLITLLNLAIGGLVWWFRKPPPIDDEMRLRMDLQAAALEPEARPAAG